MAVSGQQLPNTTYKGYCRDSNHDKSNIGFINVKDLHACHIECKNNIDCIAFAFNSKPSFRSPNCDLYSVGQRGPYVTGTGSTNIVCYVLPGNYQVLKITRNR